MDFIPSEISEYSKMHTSAESELLKKIDRETHAEVLKPRMVSGHLQGRFLSMVSHMVKPTYILEIGTYTGYSAVCLTEGLQPNGKIVTIDINEELEARVRAYFREAGLTKRVEYIIGDATKIIPTLTSMFDLVFIDADKENYSNYYDLVFDRLHVGGFILADNVLWNGKVVRYESDKDTKAIKEFNLKVVRDNRVSCVMLPIRDGIMLIQKMKR
jgi:caffeoyl-CoA O-methyltransferase